MSKAALARNCPLAFNLKYVDKVKAKVKASSAAGRIGTAVHQVLENYLKGTDIREAIRKAFIDNKLTTNEMDEVAGFAHNIIAFKKRLETFKTKHRIVEVDVEVRFGFDQDLRPTKFFDDHVFMRGVWDLAMRAGNHAIIIDHKSGAKPSTDKDVFDKHGDQMRIYSIAALNRFPGIVGVQSAFHYVGAEDIVFGQMVSSETIRNQFVPWYIDHLNSCAEHIPSRAARTGWFCSFCEYVPMCPVKGAP